MIYNKIENASVVVGSAYGIILTNIHTILGIIILAFQLAIILAKYITKIIKNVKEKNYKEIVENVEDIVDVVDDFTDKLEEIKEKDRDK